MVRYFCRLPWSPILEATGSVEAGSIPAVKIYTKTGDEGQTGLFSGERVDKSHRLVEAYGTLDELNSQLGVVLAARPQEEIRTLLHRLQILLFDAGADLATRPGHRTIRRIEAEDVAAMESQMDAISERLPALRAFILPGGTPAAAALQLARTVARRAERAALRAHESDPVNGQLLILLNRISDYLFLLARLENFLAGEPETEWRSRPVE
jgi:cob(I)alamin adenosyltransferase